MAVSEKIDNLDKLISLASEERWYTMPSFYMVQFIDKSGTFDGFFPALCQTHKEAEELSAKLSEGTEENTHVVKYYQTY